MKKKYKQTKRRGVFNDLLNPNYQTSSSMRLDTSKGAVLQTSEQFSGAEIPVGSTDQAGSKNLNELVDGANVDCSSVVVKP